MRYIYVPQRNVSVVVLPSGRRVDVSCTSDDTVGDLIRRFSVAESISPPVSGAVARVDGREVPLDMPLSRLPAEAPVELMIPAAVLCMLFSFF